MCCDRLCCFASSFMSSVKVVAKVVPKSVSRIKIAACFCSIARAFLVWWSSATLGEGINITGFPTTHNSLTELAPAREIITSATA